MHPNPDDQTRCDKNDSMNNRIDLGRLSMSDANLNISEHPRSSLGGRAQSHMNITASARSALVPLSATLNENKELKSELEMCRAQLQVANYREREARALLSKEVNAIIEEYFKLQLVSVETDEKLREFESFHATLSQVTLERDEALQNLSELQQVAQKNMEHYENHFEQFNREVESGRTQASTGYEDFTLASSVADSDVAELQAKLKEALEENIKLSDLNTEKFAKNHNLQNVNDKMTEVIQCLIQNESMLTKKLEKFAANELLNATPQLEFSTRSEQLKMVTQLETELNSLRSANWDMRSECARIKGEHLDASYADKYSFMNNKREAVIDDSTSSPIDDYMSQAKNVLNQMRENFGIDLNATNCEMPAVNTVHNNASLSNQLNQTSTLNEEYVSSSLMNSSQAYNNASFAYILQVSINTSEDVRQVKVKLETLRELFISMFERLKGSAAVFEEVYKYLANGSADNKELAEKIRQMKLEFSEFSSDEPRVRKAVTEAEKSMIQLQSNLSVLEQSLNQSTSFILDASRRSSIGASQIKANNIQPSHVVQNNVISQLQEKSAAYEADIEELKNLIKERNTSLAAVTEARDSALSSVDSLRERLKKLNEENAEIIQQRQTRDFALQNSQSNVSQLNIQLEKLTEDIKNISKEKEMVKKTMDGKMNELEETQQQILHLEQELQDIKQAVCKQCRKKTSRVTSRAMNWIKTKFGRSEITQRLILTTEELEKTKGDLVDRKAAFDELCFAKEECLKKLSQIELDYQHLRNKFTEIELISKKRECAITAERDRVIEESSTARETMDLLGRRIEELETSLEVFERKEANSIAQVNEVLEMSCVARANNVHKSTETVISSSVLDELINQKDQLQGDLDKLHDIYSNLATAIYNYVTPCSPPDQLYIKDMDSIKFASEELVELLQEASEKNNSALQQIDYIIASQEIQRNVSHNSGDDDAVTFKYKHQESKIDEHKYSSKLRQDFYNLTTLAMDLTANIKNAEIILRPHNKVDLVRILNDSRKLRGELNKHYTMIGKSDKENVIPQTMSELVDMNQVLTAQNEHLHKSLKDNRAQLQQIKNKGSCLNIDPSLAHLVQDELSNIEKVMSVACEAVKNVPVLGKK